MNDMPLYTAKTIFNSTLKFNAEVSDTHYTSASGYASNPTRDNSDAHVVTVEGKKTGLNTAPLSRAPTESKYSPARIWGEISAPWRVTSRSLV